MWLKKNTAYLGKLCVLICCLTIVSCKSKKKLDGTNPKNASIEMEDKASTNLKKILLQQTDFSTFSTKATTELSMNGNSFDVTMNIRIKKGEGIWVSVTYFAGLEAARALITPDSIKVMDKINNNYIKKPFSFVNQYANEKIDYATLEAILVGNCIPFTLNNKRELLLKNEGLVIDGQTNQMLYYVNFNSDLKPASTTLKTTNDLQNLTVNVASFENIGGNLIPKILNIASAAGSKSIGLKMDYNKTVLNEPVDFPFNVSKRFSVIE